jgi:acyl dehydratase
VSVALEVTDKQERRKIITLDCKAYNQAGKVVVTGSAEVMAPAQKLSIERPPLPRVQVLPRH